MFGRDAGDFDRGSGNRAKAKGMAYLSPAPPIGFPHPAFLFAGVANSADIFSIPRPDPK
ncbi:MAG: hypothetical protein U0Q18_06750 [Bryobacteraceae bacterium]